MEEIVQYIIQRLTNREKKTLTLSSKTNFSNLETNRQYYLDYKNIVIKGIGALTLNKIQKKEESCLLTSFLYSALDYGCEISLQLSFDCPELIERSALEESPFQLLNYQKKRYQSLSGKFITYKDVALFDTSTILIIFEEQGLTDLAKEQLAKNQVYYVERGKIK